MAVETKKFLDETGVKHILSRLDEYPDNKILGAVIDAIDEAKADKEQVEALYESLASSRTLRFYCVEDVTIILNGVSTTYPANSNVEAKFLETDEFEIIPTSDNSILALNAFPGALGTYYSWLEGVKQFSNILFDMNSEDMYTKWNQGNQGEYQVQYAQYSNCIFWSDNPYINDVALRTNYTLYNSSQLPLCYSSIPDNTFKAFYLALSVNNDPNWGNPAYKESFAKATYATQVFSYYGARVIGTPEHFSITLPADCRGLMCYAKNTEAAGTFDATNTTNFGAKSGSWREAFGFCGSLRRLYITNLKVNLNISWSPIDYDSIYYIISNAANTNAITISVSPYTYNLLSSSDFELAASKNITIELITTNHTEDKRLSDIANKADKNYVDEKITALVNSAPETLDTLGELATALQENEEVVNVLNEAIILKADKIYVDELIAGIPTESDIVIVDCPDGSVISHTFEQIVTAANNGKAVYAFIYGSIIAPLTYIADDGSFVEFHSVGTKVDENQFTEAWIDGLKVNSDNTFTVKYQKLATKEYVDENFAKKSENGNVVIEGEIQADNIPYTISEVTLLTIPAETIANVITNNIETTFTIDSFSYDTNNIVYASYGGKEYASIIQTDETLEFFVANPYVNDGFACVINFGVDADGNVDETKATFIYRTMDSENITDLVLTQIVVNTIDSKFLDHDFTIINSISMNRRGDTGIYSTALGTSCVASGDYSFATGLASEATGPSATALGKGAFATGEAALATGLMTTAGREALATGRYCEATGRGSLATGNSTIASGTYSLAEGQSTQATSSYTHAEGFGSIAKATGAHAEGNYTLASSQYQHVEGKYNVEDAANKYAHIVGNGTSSARKNAHTVDWNGNGWFQGDVYVGSTSGMTKDEGSLKLATEKYVDNQTENVLLKTEQDLTNEELNQVRKNLRFIGKDVEGQEFTIDDTTVIASPNAEIFGDYETNIAVGQWSIAEGSGTVAKGRASHAEGAMTQALMDGTHTEGYGTKATGYWSHAEGEMTIVSSYASHAEGSYCTMPDGSKRYTTASGYASHAEGGGCYTTGSCAHAEGLASTASGNQAHVEGRYTIAAGSAQHVEGAANIEDTENKYIHIAGNGTSPTDRSNAHTLDWDGNAWFAGTVKVGGTSYDDASEIALKTDLDNYYTKTEINALELITVDDIDEICGATIEVASNIKF